MPSYTLTVNGRRQTVDVPEGAEKPGAVYLVDDSVMSVVQDMIREYNRKKKKDEEKAARREKIPSEIDPDALKEQEGSKQEGPKEEGTQ